MTTTPYGDAPTDGNELLEDEFELKETATKVTKRKSLVVNFMNFPPQELFLTKLKF